MSKSLTAYIVTTAIRSSNYAVERTAGSHALAAAAHRGR
jgi:hypothetical protein